MKRADCHQAVSAGSLALGEVFWPTQLHPAVICTVSNILEAIKGHVSYLSSLVYWGLYEGVWQDFMQHLHPARIAFCQFGSVSVVALTQVLKARDGQTWTMKQAVKMHRPCKPGQAVPTFPRCPLYQSSESITHLLGE